MTEVKTKVEFGRNGKGVERLWLRVHAVFAETLRSVPSTQKL